MASRKTGFAKKRFVAVTCVLAAWAAVCSTAATNDVAGGAVSGHVHITRRLTKQRAAASSTYHRGAAVPPKEAEADFVQAELARTAVYVETRAPLPARPVTVEVQQRNRAFVPETVIVPAGSSVSFPNLDPIFHNVFSLSKPQAFDLGNYPRNETRIVRFAKPGIVPVYCHLHPDMRATIVVTPNSWTAVPSRDGTYSIDALPPGTYDIVVWHRSAGFFRKTVQVRAGAVAPLDFTIPVDEQESKR